MSNLGAIRVQSRTLVGETDVNNTNFSDGQLNDFINQGTKYLGTLIEYPRKFYEVQVTVNQPKYLSPTDTMYIRTAYFGDKTISDDTRPIKIMTEETLGQLKGNWRETNTQNAGRPVRMIILDQSYVSLDPPPDAASSATGKLLQLGYVNVPATLVNDVDIPELPLPYHDLVQFYVAHLCHLKKENPAQSNAMFVLFTSKVTALKASVLKESKDGFMFQWGFSDELDSSDDWGIQF